MTNPVNYSGVTINITTPTMNAYSGNYSNVPRPQIQVEEKYVNQNQIQQQNYQTQPIEAVAPQYVTQNQSGNQNSAQTYPAEYYINNYNNQTQNYQQTQEEVYNNVANRPEQIKEPASATSNPAANQTTQQQVIPNQQIEPQQNYVEQAYILQEQNNVTYPQSQPQDTQQIANQTSPEQQSQKTQQNAQQGYKQINQEPQTSPQTANKPVQNQQQEAIQPSAYQQASVYDNSNEEISKEIITDIDTRIIQQKAEEKNTKKTKIVSLTDEYIMSLENYLNNPDNEIRIMASKEILKRLGEDRDRYDDAALNALLNKMLQDPAKIIRIAALSAFSSELASGNDYTVKLLKDIQNNPNADKEDVLEASSILLKMSSTTEIKYIPVEENKANKEGNEENG